MRIPGSCFELIAIGGLTPIHYNLHWSISLLVEVLTLMPVLNSVIHTREYHRNISGSIQRSRANRLDKRCLLPRSTDTNTERILFGDSSAGAGGGELCRFGFTTRTMIMPKTSRASRIITLRLTERRWYPVACNRVSTNPWNACMQNRVDLHIPLSVPSQRT